MADHVCDAGDFDRTVCPEPCGMMHSYCTFCGKRQDSCAHDRLFNFILGAPDELEFFTGLLPELASVLPVIRAAQADAFDEGVQAAMDRCHSRPDNPYRV